FEKATEPAPAVRITATVKTRGVTGVEMEALTAVSSAALTVYDMIKAVISTPRSRACGCWRRPAASPGIGASMTSAETAQDLRARNAGRTRSEEHTSELQSRFDLVCRLLLEKKKIE